MQPDVQCYECENYFPAYHMQLNDDYRLVCQECWDHYFDDEFDDSVDETNYDPYAGQDMFDFDTSDPYDMEYDR